MITGDLFADSAPQWHEALGDGAMLLHGFALPVLSQLLPELEAVLEQAPLRQMVTPGGRPLSVTMSNAGLYGWVSDRQGYRYVTHDPHRAQPWPAMPACWQRLAAEAAAQAGFPGFEADVCLINCYHPGARMALHQDRDERDFTQPIVSLSLGLPAVFLFGGHLRQQATQRLLLQHGDVLVWGGPARLRYHGVLPVKPGLHPLLGAVRFNLTFRRAR